MTEDSEGERPLKAENAATIELTFICRTRTRFMCGNVLKFKF